ncbi:MAG: hypothetical protein H6818_23920 [Phycisphaerales bacterium]|nr:hypothetical protein [Phycisphaerales bacterium]
MNDRACRLACMIGLGPLAAGLTFVYFGIGGPIGLPDVQFPCVMVTATAMLATFVLWWQYIQWDRRRRIGTILLVVPVVAHLIVFQPIWWISCDADRDTLVTAQCLGVYGLFRLAAPFLWWGLFIISRKRKSPKRLGGRRRMTRTAIRILLGLSLVPILPALFFISLYTWDFNFGLSDEWNATVSLIPCEMLAIGLWIAIWRTEVRWTHNRVVATAILACAFLATIAVPYFDSSSESINSIVCSSPVWMWGFWIIGTAWLWRNRPGHAAGAMERLSEECDIGPQCPSCAYSLRGLSEARCPECGWKGTLDAVLDASLGLGDV